MTDRTLATIPKNSSERLVVMERAYHGHELIDLRIHFTPDGGQTWHPTKKGVSLKRELLPELIEALRAAGTQVSFRIVEFTPENRKEQE
ncbi:MAG: transcriptional coactivator p15/PC4 family protein [Geminicoccaceae bacterium]|nr:transcriptional coactivator p15/PC4 family protein [Geminicoccaceae bacterium]